MTIEILGDVVRVPKPEYAHFFPLLAGGLAKKLLGAAANAVANRFASSSEEEDPEAEEYDTHYDISVPGLLNDESEARKVVGALLAELDNDEEQASALLDVLDDAIGDAPQYAHFKKKLKKLKGKFKKGLGALNKLTSKLGPLGKIAGMAVPGLNLGLMASNVAGQMMNDSLSSAGR